MLVQEKKPVIIFSVYKAGLIDSENERNHENAKKTLASWKIPYKELIGCYKKSQEKSFLVFDNLQNMVNIYELVRLNNQESILLLDENRNAELVYIADNPKREKLGKFKAVDKETAEKKDNFTFDPEYKTYWITESE
jgi:hypothetical protein